MALVGTAALSEEAIGARASGAGAGDAVGAIAGVLTVGKGRTVGPSNSREEPSILVEAAAAALRETIGVAAVTCVGPTAGVCR